MLKEITISIQSYFEAHHFIRKHRLWKWIIIPGIVYTLLFIIGIYFFLNSSNEAVGWISKQTGLTAWLEKERNEWLSFLFVMVGFIVWLVSLLFYFSFFKYFFLIIGAPVFAYLSEKTTAIVEGNDYPFSFSQFISDIGRGVKLALRNTLWQAVYMISLMLLSLIPLVGWIAPMIGFFIECYYYGFSMLDYSLERNKLSPAQSIDFVGRHKGLAIGNGMLFYLMHIVPVVGWVLAPAYAVVAATLSLHRLQSEEPVIKSIAADRN